MIGSIQYVEHVNELLDVCTIIGVVACAISGALRAIDSKMDITGAMLLAFMVANGGGTIRDLILGTEVFWIKNHYYIWLAILVGILTFVCVYFNPVLFAKKIVYNLLLVTDAIGLAVFTLVGAEKSQYLGFSFSIAFLMGVWTAVGGGILADVIANRTPLVFSSELYLTISALGSVLYLWLCHVMDHRLASVIAVVFMIIARLLSIRYRLKYPIIKNARI